MKFTALEEYGLRCILHLARKDFTEDASSATSRPPARPPLPTSLTLGEIASHEGLTQQYAGKIFRILARAGLVGSERGRKGGYRLTRRPEDITLSEVVAALGGRFFDRKLCGRYTGDKPQCVHLPNCAVRLLWMEVERVVDVVLVKTTLKDLIDRERAMDQALKKLPQELAPQGLTERRAVVGPPDCVRATQVAGGEA